MTALMRFVHRQIAEVSTRPELRVLLTEGLRIPEVNTQTHSRAQWEPLLEYFRAHGYPKSRIGPRGLVLRRK